MSFPKTSAGRHSNEVIIIVVVIVVIVVIVVVIIIVIIVHNVWCGDWKSIRKKYFFFAYSHYEI